MAQVAGQTSLQRWDELKSEEVRARSFYHAQNPWPVVYMNPDHLAGAGFFFTGIEDKVQCAFCRGSISTWLPLDDPLAEHRIHFYSRCVFLRSIERNGGQGEDIGNIPRARNYLVGVRRVRDNFTANTESPAATAPPTSSSIQWGVAFRPPKYLSMVDINKRLATFVNWPSTQTPSSMAAAGFVYTNVRDNVFCFHCGVSLLDWTQEDDPFLDHLKFSPGCYFANINAPPKTEAPREEVKQILTVKCPIKEESQKNLNRAFECCICMDAVRTVVFMPCRHLACCAPCSSGLSKCAICRAKIVRAIKVILS